MNFLSLRVNPKNLTLRRTCSFINANPIRRFSVTLNKYSVVRKGTFKKFGFDLGHLE